MHKKHINLFIILVLGTLFIFCIQAKVQALTIVLDPGHGGIDSGAVSGSIRESDVTLKIAKYLRDYLQEYENVSVSLTHEGIASGEVTVFDRGIMARDRKADLLVSLHINSSTSASSNGAEVYVTANTSLDKYNKETTQLGNKILANLASLGIANRGVKTRLLSTDTTDRYSDGTMADYYGIIRYAMRGTKIDYGVIWPTGKEPANIQNGEGVPAILVEHCFISSSKDRAFLDSDDDLKKIAKADADAIVSHYNLKLKTDEPEKLLEIDEKNKKIKILPDITLEELVQTTKMDKESMKDVTGKKTTNLATGNKVMIEEEQYDIILLGDVNGDGKVLATDALAVLKHSINAKKIEGLYIEAADVKNDTKILATDALTILKYSIGAEKIKI